MSLSETTPIGGGGWACVQQIWNILQNSSNSLINPIELYFCFSQNEVLACLGGISGEFLNVQTKVGTMFLIAKNKDLIIIAIHKKKSTKKKNHGLIFKFDF